MRVDKAYRKPEMPEDGDAGSGYVRRRPSAGIIRRNEMPPRQTTRRRGVAATPSPDSPPRRRRDPVSDDSPPRRRRDPVSDDSPPRRRRDPSSDDSLATRPRRYISDHVPFNRRTGLVSLATLLVALEAEYYVLSLGSNWSRLIDELRRTRVDGVCRGCTKMVDLTPGQGCSARMPWHC